MTVATRPGRPLVAGEALGLVAFVIMAAAQIAIPLAGDATVEWLSVLVVASFAVITVSLAAAGWGAGRAGAVAGSVVAVTFGVEHLGSSTGFPFGEYRYTGALEPTVGGVPVIVPLAWLAMGVPALVAGRWISASRTGSVVIGGLALAAWDLFLDPQMVEAGYWEWAGDGVYEGIPLTNYAGWVGVGIVVLAGVDRLLPRRTRAEWPLLGLYTWWAVMSTLGFLVFFGEPVVGVVGGLGMGTVAALAWRGGPAAGAGTAGVHG
jgi:uncharacterized membrane protein